MNRTILFFVALMMLFAGGYLIRYTLPESSGSSVEKDESYIPPVAVVENFEFTDQLGKPFSSKSLDGKIWLGSFFFADCPGICIQQNAEIAKIHKRFRDRGVQVVNITVTPEKDPPHKLWQYANRLEADHKSWKFLTGRKISYVRQVGIDIFQLAAADESHTSEVALFDRDGNSMGTYDVTKPKEFTKIVMELENLLASEEADSTQATQPDNVTAQPDSGVPST